MRRALEIAAPMMGRTGDNPAVGCVIVKDGVVIAQAVTGAGGRPHAEEQAVALADARGATAYVTLEPCAQRSARGVSCTDHLLRAGVARVVIAADDPHPLAAGVGLAKLAAAGVEVVRGVLADAARAQNASFFARFE